MKNWTLFIACFILSSCTRHQAKEREYGYHDYATDKLMWEDSTRKDSVLKP